MKREKIKIPKETNSFKFDFTNTGTFELNGESYEFVEDYPSRVSDGEDHNYVFKRKSDNKLFKYFWWYHHSSGNYVFEEREMIEVEVVIIKGYGWNGKLFK